MRFTILGTLLLAASLAAQTPADPRIDDGVFRWLNPGHTPQQVEKLLGTPHMVAPFGDDFLSWQYRLGADHHDASHTLVFRRSTGRLISITRSYDADESIARFFPSGQSEEHLRRIPGQPPYPVLLRRLPGDCLLLAMGATQRRPVTGQLILIERQELSAFHPWLIPLLDNKDR